MHSRNSPIKHPAGKGQSEDFETKGRTHAQNTFYDEPQIKTDYHARVPEVNVKKAAAGTSKGGG